MTASEIYHTELKWQSPGPGEGKKESGDRRKHCSGLEGGKKNLCLHSPPRSPIRCIRIAACVERLYPPLPSLPNLKGMILLEGKERERRDGEPQVPRSALCRPSAGMQGWHGLGESRGSHSAVLKL